MAEDWFADVQKYDPDADEATVRKIVTYLGIALRNRDSSLVSFSDPAEVDRVRERFLRKKLALTDPDDTLNAVRDLMSADRTKNRVTVYYLLADWFGKLDLFGGTAGTPGGFSSAAAGRSAPEAMAADEPRPPLRAVPAAEPMPAPASDVTPPPRPEATADVPRHSEAPADGGLPSWLKWLLILLALAVLFFLVRSCMASERPGGSPAAQTTSG